MQEPDARTERVAAAIVDAALAVHRQLGPGLLERVYRLCLVHELRERGFTVDEERPIPIVYAGRFMDAAFRVDLLVDDRVLVELKAVEAVHEAHVAQTLTYLRLTDKHLALLINFGEVLLKDGLHRFINKAHGVRAS